MVRDCGPTAASAVLACAPLSHRSRVPAKGKVVPNWRGKTPSAGGPALRLLHWHDQFVAHRRRDLRKRGHASSGGGPTPGSRHHRHFPPTAPGVIGRAVHAGVALVPAGRAGQVVQRRAGRHRVAGQCQPRPFGLPRSGQPCVAEGRRFSKTRRAKSARTSRRAEFVQKTSPEAVAATADPFAPPRMANLSAIRPSQL